MNCRNIWNACIQLFSLGAQKFNKIMRHTVKVLLMMLILQSVITNTMARSRHRDDDCGSSKKVMKMYFPIVIATLSTSVLCYHRDYGPVIGPFQPSYMELTSECTETNQHACLVIPTKKICREKLSKVTLNPFLPLPWWYFYCQWVVTLPPAKTTKTSTIHPFYRKTLDEVLQYKKNLKNGNSL
ncbi:hypothetical protein PYW08_016059 [Mythimna loreyi]|uniref:Uncharacterized protein n=1 Tax=Mythimna loreyi TaxID=667449 RepID=A0ACC2QWP9_9NEOP|nr:hypothetical protein PYW08_016059 [Mythimna loreyi]